MIIMAKDILNMKSACAYIRVSTDKQEELSPDAQKRLLIDFAKKNNMSLLAENIYIDNGISGKKADKRPEFMKMIGMAKSKEHPFDVILVWKFSRFARNQEESIVYKSLLNCVLNINDLNVLECYNYSLSNKVNLEKIFNDNMNIVSKYIWKKSFLKTKTISDLGVFLILFMSENGKEKCKYRNLYFKNIFNKAKKDKIIKDKDTDEVNMKGKCLLVRKS